jgi:hypothetical protein
MKKPRRSGAEKMFEAVQAKVLTKDEAHGIASGAASLSRSARECGLRKCRPSGGVEAP